MQEEYAEVEEESKKSKMGEEKVKKYFLGRKDKDELRETRIAYNKLRKAGLTSKKFDNLRYMSFLMFKPDAVASGKVRDLLKDFNKEKIYIAKIKLVMPSMNKLDQMYSLIRKRYAKIYDIIVKQLSGDMVIPCLLIGDPKKFSHLPEKIKILMGPTTVITGDKKHLRYKYKGSGRGFNLMHGTDDPAMAVREALVWFTPKEIISAINLVEKFKKGKKINPLDAEDFKKVMKLKRKISYEISEEFALFRMKDKIIKEISKIAKKEEKKLLNKLKTLLKKEYQIFKKDIGLKQRRLLLLREFKKQQEIVTKLLQTVESEIYHLLLKQTGKVTEKRSKPLKKKLELYRFLQCCVNEEKYAEDDILEHLITLAHHGVKVELWDEILLLARRIGLDTVRKHIKQHLGEKYL
jgi:nucleoside diphosphate kinase